MTTCLILITQNLQNRAGEYRVGLLITILILLYLIYTLIKPEKF